MYRLHIDNIYRYATNSAKLLADIIERALRDNPASKCAVTWQPVTLSGIMWEGVSDDRQPS